MGRDVGLALPEREGLGRPHWRPGRGIRDRPPECRVLLARWPDDGREPARRLSILRRAVVAARASCDCAIPSFPGWVAFSPDRRLVALETSPAVVQVIDAATGATVARLEDPDSGRARWVGFTGDGRRLVTVTPFSRTVHVWDIGKIARQLAILGLNDGRLASPAVEALAREDDPVVEVATDVSATVRPVVEQKAAPRSPDISNSSPRVRTARRWNNLAWAYLTAPEPLRDPSQGLATAEKATRLDPGNPAYRNTLGVAYYRAGRYREAIDLLRSNAEAEDDRSLVFDLCFLAMSHHKLGETPRAREYLGLAHRWMRHQKALAPEDHHELDAILQEMEATLGR